MEPNEITETLFLSSIDSPLGSVMLATTAKGLLYLCLPGGEQRMNDWLKRHAPSVDKSISPRMNRRVEMQLRDYFDGRSRIFDLPLDLRGTPFQIAVWRAIARIPYGATATYGEIAKEVKRPGAARAVGGAANRNPVPIVVPCHRVIGSDRRLVGYGGGLGIKKTLLRLEGFRIMEREGRVGSPTP
jgi:methylated-DNA-[protein]-cysteine S-methyltransferase